MGSAENQQSINMKREVTGTIEEVILRSTNALQEQGFGILTRIDLHLKIKEKLGKALAFEAYSANSDVTSVLPCNAVIRELKPGRISVELARPTALMEILHDDKLKLLAKTADRKLEAVLEGLSQKLAPQVL